MNELLEEYGVTASQAEAAEAAALMEIEAARKAGELTEFSGSLGHGIRPSATVCSLRAGRK